MNYKKAKTEIPNIQTFLSRACNCCDNEWYCPTHCDLLEKAQKIPFYRIVKCYQRHDGDMKKVFRYIKNTKERLFFEK